MALRDILADMGTRRRTVTVYSPDPRPELADSLADWNVELRSERLPEDAGTAFVIVRSGGEFLGSVGLRTLGPLLEPTGDRVGEDPDAGTEAFLELLDDTLFRTDHRRHLLGVSHEFEDRAWRVGRGALHAGFQRPAAFGPRRDAYATLADRGIDVHVYADGEWDLPVPDGVTSHTGTGGELGRYWFVAFDDTADDVAQSCGLLAEEYDPDAYAGYWTYDPEQVTALVEYLTATYPED